MNYLKKLLIVYTNSGAGHRRAAEALYRAAEAGFPGLAVKLIDTLDYATPVFKRTYPQTYLTLVNHFPWFWGLSYYFLDMRWVDKIARIFRRRINAYHCKKFEALIQEENPDLVITTHFLPNEIISFLKKKQKIRTLLVTCITDFYPHAFWRDQGVDLYITPNSALTPRLVQLGIPESKIVPLGIPIDPVFNEPLDQTELRLSLGLQDEKFTVLIASGGFGVGPVAELVEEVLKITQPLQLLVVCGNNSKLETNLSKYTSNTPHDLRIYGFIGNMHELMSAADVIITKSGGLTTAEAMAKGLPMIILFPIPGQELSNCRFIVNRDAGLRARNTGEARVFIENLLQQPKELQRMKENLYKLGRPDAAQDILRYITEWLKKERKKMKSETS